MTHTHEALTAAAERAARDYDDHAKSLQRLEREYSCDGVPNMVALYATLALASKTAATTLRAIGPELARLTAENERLREALTILARLPDFGRAPVYQSNSQSAYETQRDFVRDTARAALAQPTGDVK